jgi:hypothetical protein
LADSAASVRLKDGIDTFNFFGYAYESEAITVYDQVTHQPFMNFGTSAHDEY